MNDKFFTQDEYIEILKNELDTDQCDLMAEQMKLFYSLQNQPLKKNHYNLGDMVVLKKNMLLHGLRNVDNIQILESIKNHGLISNTFRSDNKTFKVNYCTSLWHIKKNIMLGDYVNLYSGMTVRHNWDNLLMVPYGKMDEYIESIKNKNLGLLYAESNMEILFLPNLAQNDKKVQLALILNAQDKICQPLMNNNLLGSNIDKDLAIKFFHVRDPKGLLENAKHNEHSRIAYIPFGFPSSMIEGILVGRIAEKNQKLLSQIKQIFPDCYICNIDGKIIVAN